MTVRRMILGLLATAATALPAAAQSVYVYPPRYYPPTYAPPAYVAPPTYVYPPRYYRAPPPVRYYPAYPPQPQGEPDYWHRSNPGSPDPPMSTTPPSRPYVAVPPSYGAVPPSYGGVPQGAPPPGADLYQWMVASIQQELAARGYSPGPASGQMDPRTEEAIRTYQQSAGLPVTGMPSEGLLDHLRGTAAARGQGPYYPPPGPPPGGGAARNDATVAWVQDALNRRGYNVGAPDGILGQRTRQAIERFKKDNGLPVDSLINELLIERLRT